MLFFAASSNQIYYARMPEMPPGHARNEYHSHMGLAT
jgi:hypothetical protein